MVQVIGVRFQKGGKIYFFGADDFDVNSGDYVIVETVKGIEIAEVSMGKTEMEEERLATPLKQIIRKANEQDIHHSAELRVHEKEAFAICQKKIFEHKLEMKLVGVEDAFDNSKITFFFTANGRVDFRSLVKDLASVFKTRIELRQIGVRDEARMIGGLGPCGRQICCGSFLEDFEPVSIKMAKEQNLSLNPTKISGVCGRLMCCLKYEEDAYEETRKRMPRIGKEVITPDGIGVVNDLNIVKETVKVRIAKGDSYEINEYALDQIQRTDNSNHVSQENSEDAEPVDVNTVDENTENQEVAVVETAKVSEDTVSEKDVKIVSQNDTLDSDQNVPQVNNENNRANSSLRQDRSNQNSFHKNHPLGQPVRREKKEYKESNEIGNEKRKYKSNFHGDNNRPNVVNDKTASNVQEDKPKYQSQFVSHNKRAEKGKEQLSKPENAPSSRADQQHTEAPSKSQQTVAKKNNWQADLERAMKAAGDKKE